MKLFFIWVSVVLLSNNLWGQEAWEYAMQKSYEAQSESSTIDVVYKKFYKIKTSKAIVDKIQETKNSNYFILEVSNEVSGFVIGKIWNDSVDINYSFRESEGLKIVKKSFFETQLCELISNWDRVEINKRSEGFSGFMSPRAMIYASKINLHKKLKKVNVECFFFSEFENCIRHGK